MTEKRFELKVNQHNQCDIVDWVESKEKNAICIYNDLGDCYFSSAKALCELLNELDDNWIKELNLRETLQLDLQRVEEENKELKQDCDNLIDDNTELVVELNQDSKKLKEVLEENGQLKSRINSRLHFYRELYDSTNDSIVKRVVKDLEDILKR